MAVTTETQQPPYNTNRLTDGLATTKPSPFPHYSNPLDDLIDPHSLTLDSLDNGIIPQQTMAMMTMLKVSLLPLQTPYFSSVSSAAKFWHQHD